MKTVKSALLGNRQIIEGTQSALEYQFKEIIKEHRSIIITRLIGDLHTYLHYKFQFSRLDKKQLDEVREKLLNLKNDGVKLTHYQHLFNQLNTKALIHLTNEPFYTEIDESLAHIMATHQLKIV